MSKATTVLIKDEYDSGLQAFKEHDYERAVAIWLAASDDASAESVRKIADGLSAVAKIWYADHSKDVETEKLYAHAIELRQTFLPENDPSIAIELNNLGMFYERASKRDKAIDLLSKSIAILDTHAELDKENYADPYDNLADLLFKTGNLERAQELCQRALEIRDCTMGKINPLSVCSLEFLADIQDAIKSGSRTARETRKEYRERLQLLSVAYRTSGDPLLSETLFVASQLGGRHSETMVSTALRILAQQFLRHRR